MFSKLSDKEWLNDVSTAKRFLELITMVPEFKENLEKNPEEVLKQYKINAKFEDLRYLYCVDDLINIDKVPKIAKSYREFSIEKLKFRDELQTKKCVPSNKNFAKWRQRQVNRCWGELGIRSAGMVHSPIMYELSEGCSVGCFFCALSSKKLSGTFKGTDENLKLWKNILTISKKILGDAAGSGTCYYATEPFDNLDYEKFCSVYYEVYSNIPQLTTAVSTRNVERTKKFIEKYVNIYPTIHRFSVLSLQVLLQIHNDFSPEELIQIELLPQFKEAPRNKFMNVGRNYKKVSEKENLSAETVSCTTGFIVNMQNKSIRLLTPCGASDRYPNGEIVLDTENFTDEKDFESKINLMIKRSMKTEISNNQIIKFHSYLSFKKSDKGFIFESPGMGIISLDEFEQDEYNIFLNLIDCITYGNYTRFQLAEKFLEEFEISPERTFHALDILFDSGTIVEN